MLLRVLFILTVLPLLSDCGSVVIRDSIWCGDMGAQGAICVHTMTSGEYNLDKATWDQTRYGQICTVPGTFADWKSDIEKLCSETGNCDYESKTQADHFFSRIESIKTRN